MKTILFTNYPRNFIEYLMREMNIYTQINFPVSKTLRVYKYFVDELNINLSPKSIALMATKNLKTDGYNNGKVEIMIKSSVKIPGSDMTLLEACKTINFGAQASGVPGYPFFTEMFQYFQDNAEEMYDDFVMRGGF